MFYYVYPRNDDREIDEKAVTLEFCKRKIEGIDIKNWEICIIFHTLKKITKAKSNEKVNIRNFVLDNILQK